jgi:uncharacterized membrane protein AbrB (regulator of aidB expression)
MEYRSPKVQLLFWLSFFAIIFYLWLIGVGVSNFIFKDETRLAPPSNVIFLMFVLYGLLIVDILAGIFIATMINNRYYQRFFGILLMIAFFSFLVAKGLFG